MHLCWGPWFLEVFFSFRLLVSGPYCEKPLRVAASLWLQSRPDPKPVRLYTHPACRENMFSYRLCSFAVSFILLKALQCLFAVFAGFHVFSYGVNLKLSATHLWMLWQGPAGSTFPQTIPAVATTGTMETNRISRICEAAIFSSSLCSLLRLAVWHLGNTVDHTSGSFLLLFLKLLWLKNWLLQTVQDWCHFDWVRVTQSCHLYWGIPCLVPWCWLCCMCVLSSDMPLVGPPKHPLHPIPVHCVCAYM